MLYETIQLLREENPQLRRQLNEITTTLRTMVAERQRPRTPPPPQREASPPRSMEVATPSQASDTQQDNDADDTESVNEQRATQKTAAHRRKPEDATPHELP